MNTKKAAIVPNVIGPAPGGKIGGAGQRVASTNRASSSPGVVRPVRRAVVIAGTAFLLAWLGSDEAAADLIVTLSPQHASPPNYVEGPTNIPFHDGWVLENTSGQALDVLWLGNDLSGIVIWQSGPDLTDAPEIQAASIYPTPSLATYSNSQTDGYGGTWEMSVVPAYASVYVSFDVACPTDVDNNEGPPDYGSLNVMLKYEVAPANVVSFWSAPITTPIYTYTCIDLGYVPEPSSLTICCIELLGLGVASLVRRRRRAARGQLEGQRGT